MIETRHPFRDLATGREVILVIGADHEGLTGVAHEGVRWQKPIGQGNAVLVGCDQLAHVSPKLDCAYCTNCGWQCRISGAWFMNLWTERARWTAEQWSEAASELDAAGLSESARIARMMADEGPMS